MVIDLIVIGFAMAVYPVAVTFFILIVASRKGVQNGAGFIFGWLAALAVVAALTISATGNSPPAGGTSPSTGILVAKLVLGLLLLGIAARQRRRMRRPRPLLKEKAWRARLDEMSAVFAVGLGAFFQPSVLVVTAAATITGARLSSAADYLTLVLFGFLTVSTYLSMEIYVVLRPANSADVLRRLDSWINRNTDLMIIVGATALGLWLIGNNSYLFAT